MPSTYTLYRRKLSVCKPLWLEFARGQAIQDMPMGFKVIARPASELSGREDFKGLSGVRHYALVHPEDKREAVERPGDFLDAVVRMDTCDHACFVLHDAVKRLLEDHHEFQEVVWKKSRVLPRIVLHHENNIGKETLPSHSFLFVRTKEGKGFVVDPTGCQFGFPDWFYSDVQYERFFTGPEPEELDLEEELVWFERMAAEDSFTGKAVTLREELAALKTREIARLCD